MQLPDELNSKRQDPEDEYKRKMYQSLIRARGNHESRGKCQLIHFQRLMGTALRITG